MPKHRVLDIGNCAPDYASIKQMLCGRFDVDVIQADGAADSLELLRESQFDLILVNRKLDQDYSDGLDVIKAIKSDTELSSIPMMLVTNLEEHQQLAVAAGAVHGFGKLELSSTETHQRLSEFLA